MTADQDDQFQEDVLTLFAEEGLEWVGHIKAALEELDKGATPEREPKLYETIIRSLTNLMGSAATVDLASLQQLTLAIILLLQAVRRKTLAPTRPHMAAIRRGLALLSSAIQVLRMAESKMVVVANLESIMQLQAAHIQRVASRLEGVATASPREGAGKEDDAGKERAVLARAVASLLDLAQARPSLLEPSRHLVEWVLRRHHRMLNQEQTGIPATAVSNLLQVSEDLDAHFLKEMQARLAAVATVLRDLKSAAGNAARLTQSLSDALRGIAFLYERAMDVGAMEIAQFLHGLERVLLAVAYQGVVLSPQRLDGLSSRVETGITMARQWVEMGRAEKAEIEKALAPLLNANLARR